MRLAVVGVTGLVGTVMNQVLEEMNLPISEYIPVASEKSVGKKIKYKDKEYTIIGLQDAVDAAPDVAIFSAGGSVSLEWAPKFAAVGTTVVDNSSAWRMDPNKVLCVPEINADILTKEDKIIANPNCSTIQMVLALSRLHKRYGINRLVISTYQSFTGTGAKAVAQYEAERDGKSPEKSEMAYHYQIFENCIPQCDVFLDNGYTKEEMKLVNETKKILRDNNIAVTATAVRVPVNGGHSESINVEFAQAFELNDVISELAQTPGVVVQNDIAAFEYPMPLYSRHKNEVFVGRIRRDESKANALNLWVVADNLRKGAATNAVQIVKYLHDNQLIG
ncbi:MAG: aspartate-semialdehyde dehydrogenase [Saprospiraceae bacterium]|nr:aspartate-semialdehyde dehydrogenase [Saprospiraceae bacterium]